MELKEAENIHNIPQINTMSDIEGFHSEDGDTLTEHYESADDLNGLSVQELPKVFKKHVYAVHSTSSHGLIAKKIFNCLLSYAQSELAQKNKFSIPTKVLVRAIGYNSHDYNVLKRALEQLNKTSVQWNVLGETSSKKSLEWRTSTILACASLRDGVCNYEFSSYMQEFLADPDVYVVLDLDELAKFKSAYGISLYENCKRFIRIKHSDYIPLQAFRYLMNIADTKKYELYKDFKRAVLVPALKEVNNIAHFKVHIKEKKVGSKVVAVKLVMEKKPDVIEQKISENAQMKELKLTLEKLGVNSRKIVEILLKYSPSYISSNLNFALSQRSYKNGKIQVIPGYIVDSIESNYAKVNIEQQNRQESFVQIEKKQPLNEEDKKNAYREYVDSLTERYILSLCEKEIEGLKNRFANTLENEGGIFLDWYKKNGLEKVQTKSRFHEFVRKENADKIGEIISYEDFLTSKAFK